MSDHENDLTRRDVIKLGAAATVAASIAVGDAAAQVRVVGFLTNAELTLLDELSEMIIPADAHSPGARAANVAAFINARLAEAWHQKDRTDWRSGLALVDHVSQEMHKLPFMKASPDQRIAVLTRMAQNEKDPKTAEEKFFKELKSRVVFAYYTSEIGIKQDMEYKGNTYQNEFAGYDVTSA